MFKELFEMVAMVFSTVKHLLRIIFVWVRAFGDVSSIKSKRYVEEETKGKPKAAKKPYINLDEL